MSKEILEITPSGGLFCRIELPSAARAAAPNTIIDMAKPNGFAIAALLHDLRIGAAAESLVTEGDILRWALGMACESALARVFAHDARFEDWSVGIEFGEGCGLQIERAVKHLTIFTPAANIQSLAAQTPCRQAALFQILRGLRGIWHCNAGLANPLNLMPEDQIKFARCYEADLDICALICAYQLKRKDHRDPWRYALSDDLSGLAAMLASCLDFEDCAEGIGDETLDTMGYLFQDWFGDEARLADIDHHVLNQLDIDGDRGSSALRFDDIIQLGILPDGMTYLEYAAGDVMTDEYYARMDPVNRAHLDQILSEDRDSLQIGGVEFRDAALARKIFPAHTFETVV